MTAGPLQEGYATRGNWSSNPYCWESLCELPEVYMSYSNYQYFQGWTTYHNIQLQGDPPNTDLYHQYCVNCLMNWNGFDPFVASGWLPGLSPRDAVIHLGVRIPRCIPWIDPLPSRAGPTLLEPLRARWLPSVCQEDPTSSWKLKTVYLQLPV